MNASLPFIATPKAPDYPRRTLTISAVVTLHVLAGVALYSLHQQIVMETLPAPIRIDLVASHMPVAQEAPKIPKPAAQPAPQRSVTPQRHNPPPLIRSEVPAATASPIAAPEPVPTAPLAVTELRENASLKTAAPAYAAPATDSMVAPRFDADYLHNPAPPYPRISRDLGEEGRVVLRVQVDETGRALQVLVDVGSGFSRLDRAAREAVQAWRFVPAKRDNQPVSGWVKVPIVFELKN